MATRSGNATCGCEQHQHHIICMQCTHRRRSFQQQHHPLLADKPPREIRGDVRHRNVAPSQGQGGRSSHSQKGLSVHIISKKRYVYISWRRCFSLPHRVPTRGSGSRQGGTSGVDSTVGHTTVACVQQQLSRFHFRRDVTENRQRTPPSRGCTETECDQTQS